MIPSLRLSGIITNIFNNYHALAPYHLLPVRCDYVFVLRGYFVLLTAFLVSKCQGGKGCRHQALVLKCHALAVQIGIFDNRYDPACHASASIG